jgi:hypothetical protein
MLAHAIRSFSIHLTIPTLGILFADLNIPPLAPASSCAPSVPLYTGLLCLLTDPLRFADLPSGSPVAEQTHRLLAMLAVKACFLCSMCPAHSPATPSQPPAHACSTPCTTDTATTLDSLVGPPASVTSVLLGSPVMSPQPPPRPRICCCSPQVSCMTDTSTRSAKMRFPFLVCMSPPPPLILLPILPLPRTPTEMTKFPFHVSHTTLIWFRVMVMLLYHALVFLAFPPPPPVLLFAPNLP